MFPFIKNLAHRWYKRLETKEHPLLYLFLELTRDCNLTCKHCGSDCRAETSSAQLTTESWIKIIDYIADAFSPPPILVLSGGEPLIHPAIVAVLDAIVARGLRWGIVSNGYALDEARRSMLLAHKVESVTISLDGLEENHNWLRNRNDSFARAVAAIGLVAESGIPQFDVVTCVHSDNLGELDKIADLLLTLKVPAWRLFRIFPAGRARNNPALSLDSEETERMIEWVRINKPVLREKGLNVSLSCEGWLPYALDRQVRDAPFFCRAGINIASILSDGTITGCSNNPERFFEGNILRNDFATLWNDGFAKFRKREWVSKSYCAACRFVKECDGGSIHLWRTSLARPDFCYVKE
jgi:radical SAM protein with 4Fe4S-binding SPASM domain